MEIKDKRIRIAVFASGEGSNAETLVCHFSTHPHIEVALMVSNKETAGVYARMEKWGIPCYTIDKSEWTPCSMGKQVLDLMRRENIQLIVLAGFLAYIPQPIVKAFEGRIVNIHPSLLPKYGGKGMWGHHVHEAVIANHESVTGITIHHVTEKMDEGSIIFQTQCEVLPDDTPHSLATRIHQLEHKYYPLVVEQLASEITTY
ncbi:MAG: phosphoribosylglycinamide formyltransferase [Bacteroidaceae bacterium]|nr:phosphoribosylglycinamide formyltransferase [Bacteroidaceae bacterium]